MTKIYLIRHCEAEGNLYRRVQGSYDGLPTPRGRMQIQALAERFREEPIDALYSSDLTRAIETAGAIQKYHPLTLNIDPRLREIDMGVWENRPWGNVELDFPEQMHNFSVMPEIWHVEGSETFEHTERRMEQAVLDIAARHDGGTVAAVSHGMAIRTILSLALGITAEQAGHGDNTAVALLHVENGVISVQYYNDNSHLDENTSTFAQQSWWRESGAKDRHNLALLPLDAGSDRQLYTECYARAWEFAHGTRRGFEGDGYWRSALRHIKEDAQCVMKAFAHGEFVGLIDITLERGKRDNAGWISLCYVEPDSRGMGDSIQLIGHAVALCREKGRDKLRLHVAESNARAIAFYKKTGFVVTGRDTGVFGQLYLMEMQI